MTKDTTRSIAEMIEDRPAVNNQDIFDALWHITSELKAKVDARFDLTMDPCSANFNPITPQLVPKVF